MSAAQRPSRARSAGPRPAWNSGFMRLERATRGFRYKTAASWTAAFDHFGAERERWAAEFEGALPEPVVKGDCPWDADLI
jgi:hypothetical protein